MFFCWSSLGQEKTSGGEVKVKREGARQQSSSEAVWSRQKAGSGGVVASVSVFGFQFKERCMRNSKREQ